MHSTGCPDPVRAAVDHLIVAAADLDAGAAWLESHLGVPLAPGGKHAAMGTHNRLLKLGPQCYLELIAVDPAAAAPDRPRWFGLDDPALQERLAERPHLVHWVARCTDIEAAAAACTEPLGEILDLSRGDFLWRITVPADGHLPGRGLVPSLIRWRSPAHPADSLPERGCILMKLEGFHPGPLAIDRALGALGLAGALALYAAEPGEAPNLVAYLRVPSGLREID
jgi:hypothetical protein